MDLDEDFSESPESRVIVENIENMNQMTQKPLNFQLKSGWNEGW